MDDVVYDIKNNESEINKNINLERTISGAQRMNDSIASLYDAENTPEKELQFFEKDITEQIKKLINQFTILR